MAKINRYDGNLAAFASQADTNRRTTFGTETTGDNTLDGNLNADFFTGWQIVGPNEFPTLEDFNAAFFTIGQLMAYVHQVGVPEWNGAQEFHGNSMTNRNGVIYVCRTNNHVSMTPPEDDATNWRRDSPEQFQSYQMDRTYITGDIARGSDGVFYEFYDRDQAGTVQGTDPTDPLNRPHIWMEWDGVRPGSTIEWRSETLPEGYIENDGSEISRTDYRRVYSAFGTTYGEGDGSTTFLLPDDRGEFKRGWDNGRGVDSGRDFATEQMDALENITGSFSRVFVNPDGAQPNGVFQGAQSGGSMSEGSDPERQTWNFTFDASRVARTADETRPRNNAVIYLTKI